MRRSVARVSQLSLQLKLISCWQFRVFQTLPVSSLFGDSSCCMACNDQVIIIGSYRWQWILRNYHSKTYLYTCAASSTTLCACRLVL